MSAKGFLVKTITTHQLSKKLHLQTFTKPNNGVANSLFCAKIQKKLQKRSLLTTSLRDCEINKKQRQMCKIMVTDRGYFRSDLWKLYYLRKGFRYICDIIPIIMGAIELRNKLIEQFTLFIQDDSKLYALNGIFDAINTTESPSLVSEEHYKIVEERRRKMLIGESKGLSWDEVKQELKEKYGF